MSSNPLSPYSTAPGASLPVQSAPGVSRFAPVDPVRLLRQHSALLIITAVLAIGVGVGLWLLLREVAPQYTTTSQLVAAPTALGGAWDAPNAGGGPTNAESVSQYIATQIVRIQSEDVLNDALKVPALRATEWFQSFSGTTGDTVRDDEERAAKAKEHLQKKALSAAQHRGSMLIMVSLSGDRPNDLPLVLDTIVNTFLSKLRIDADTGSTDLRQTFTAELKRAQDDFDRVQSNLQQFVRDNDIPSLTGQANEASIQYSRLAMQAVDLQVQLEGARAAFESLLAARQQGSFNYTPTDIATVERDPAVYQRDERLRQLREEREVAMHKFGASHYHVQRLDQQIDAVTAERKKEYDRLLLEQQQVRINEARQAADTLAAQLAGLEPNLAESRIRMRDLSLKLESYRVMADQGKAAADRRDRAQAMVDDLRIQGQRTDFIRIRRQQAAIPAQMTFPKPAIVVAGTLLLLLGLVGGLVYLQAALDQRVKEPRDLKYIGNLQLMGLVPDAQDDPTRPVRVESAVQDDPSGLMAESYRQLRTALMAQMDRQGFKSLVIASPQPGSGASTVASNLSMSLAYIGRRVLLIDANLRRPRQHDIFGLAQKPGLSELLRQTATEDEAIFHKVEPDIDILPVGDTHEFAPEMLEGERFAQLLGRLGQVYDMIVIDAPPALLTSECQMLAKHVDATLMVVRAMSDKRGMIGRMLQRFEGQRSAVLGVVLNGARSSVGGYYRKNYEAFYRYNQPVNGAPSRSGTVAPTPAKA